MNKREVIFEIINKERAYQDKKYGGVEKDEYKSIGDWLIDIWNYLREALGSYTYLSKVYKNKRDLYKRTVMIFVIKIAALAVACLEYNLKLDDFKSWRK